jgi:competence ComEA-like helix-hairpin-helix protein
MSRHERHALALLLGLGLAGHAVRLVLGQSGRAPGSVTVLSTLPGDALAAHSARSARLARPLGPGERVDLNHAPAEEIARLPRVGMALAKRIVRARSESGGFQSMLELDRVPGVGPTLLASFDSLATLGDTNRVRRKRPASGEPRPAIAASPPPAPALGPILRARDLPAASRVEASTLGAPRSARPPLDLNSATAEQLIELPGIGPARARAILAYRESHGPFASVAELEKVPGVSSRLVRQLAPQVTAR